jgi:hypothetical protein
MKYQLKQGLLIKPDGQKVILQDPSGQGLYRVGPTEWRILNALQEPQSLHELQAVLQQQEHKEVPLHVLAAFVKQATHLGLVRSTDRWGALLASIGQPFLFRVVLFDPRPLLAVFARYANFAFTHIFFFCCLVIAGLGVCLLIFSWKEIVEYWLLLTDPENMALVVLLLFLSSLLHELAHGWVGHAYGFEVTEVGFGFHYFLPSFYCRVIGPLGAHQRAMLLFFSAGPLTDLVLLSLAMGLWRLLPRTSIGWQEAYLLIVALLVRVLLELNPLLPHSDGHNLLTCAWRAAGARPGKETG